VETVIAAVEIRSRPSDPPGTSAGPCCSHRLVLLKSRGVKLEDVEAELGAAPTNVWC